MALSVRVQCQGIYIPPDIYGDAGRGTSYLRKGMGQVLRTDGVPQGDIDFYYERLGPMGIHLRGKSLVSFTLARTFNDSITPDTLFRLDMRLRGDPELSAQAVGSSTGDSSNYYLGKYTIERVPAYHRAVYEEVWPYIDVHYYHASTGPRMAIVVKPGGNPADIALRFAGQDSMNVNWQGALRAYMGERFITLEQAVAYQVDPLDQTGTLPTPLPWNGTYELVDDSVDVAFTFGGYDHALPLSKKLQEIRPVER